MSNYAQLTSFTPKDSLITGNPLKLVRGAEIDAELAAISVAIATKLDSGSAANPTGTIGLAAVNGILSTYMRSDGAPALSQAISPTWSGTHTFSLAARFADGLVGTPGITFSSDLDTGIYRPGTNRLDVVTAGASHFAINDNAGVPAIDVQKGVFRILDGVIGTPSLSFSSDTDTGVYRPASNDMSFVCGAAEIFRINAGGVFPRLNTLAPDGAVGTPAFSFNSDTNTGVYRAGSDDVAVAAGGAEVCHFSSNAGLTPQVRAVDGVVGNPAFAFNSDPDTGFYRIGANSIGFAEGGVGFQVGYRNIPVSSTTTTLAITDIGKCVAITAAINIPISVFAAGDAVTIYNNSAGALNLTISAGTLRLAGGATTGTRSIAARGFCTVWFMTGGATPEVIASGNVS
jgi:hypothetical protein